MGSYQLALLAKAFNKPFYALAESYKFLRLFPLSQSVTMLIDILDTPHTLITRSDLPTPSNLGFEAVKPVAADEPEQKMSSEMIAVNPEVDYTTPNLITLVFSDVGLTTTEGISQHLVGAFADL